MKCNIYILEYCNNKYKSLAAQETFEIIIIINHALCFHVHNSQYFIIIVAMIIPIQCADVAKCIAYIYIYSYLFRLNDLFAFVKGSAEFAASSCSYLSHYTSAY